jgi:predicted TPR repeat methyltransferase
MGDYMKQTRTDIGITFDKYADSFATTFEDVSLYSDYFDEFLKYVAEGAVIHDLACGPCNVAGFLKSKRADVSFVCIDISARMLEICKTKVTCCDIHQMDMLDYKPESGSIDACICAFGVPFLNLDELNTFIANISSAMVSGGVFYISCIKGAGESMRKTSFSGDEKILFHLYSKEQLSGIFDKYGLDIAYFGEEQFSAESADSETDLIYILKKR